MNHQRSNNLTKNWELSIKACNVLTVPVHLYSCLFAMFTRLHVSLPILRLCLHLSALRRSKCLPRHFNKIRICIYSRLLVWLSAFWITPIITL